MAMVQGWRRSSVDRVLVAMVAMVAAACGSPDTQATLTGPDSATAEASELGQPGPDADAHADAGPTDAALPADGDETSDMTAIDVAPDLGSDHQDIFPDFDAPEATDSATDATGPDSADADTGAVADATDTTLAQEQFYAAENMPHIELLLDPTAVAVLSDPAIETEKTWVHARFASGGVTIEDVGVRRKGASTFRYLPQKVALKVKFNKWVKGQKFIGLTDLTLNNMVDDPTGLRERLSYFVYRTVGVPAPRCNTALLTINGESYGPYANIETPDHQLLDKLFGADAASLYEVNLGSQWLSGSEVGFTQDVGDPSEADMFNLFKVMAGAQDKTLLQDVAPVLDVDEWLTYCAVEAATGQFDHYAYGKYGSHNYFMTGDVAGKFRLMPWSTDLSFSDGPGVLDASKPLPADPVFGGVTLLGRCKAVPDCWSQYRNKIKAVLEIVEQADLVKIAKTWHAQIDVEAMNDPKREFELDYYTATVPVLYDWIAARPDVVRAQMGLK